MSMACMTEKPAQTWSELPASAYCATSEPAQRESCRIEECRNVAQNAGAPSKVDALALSTLCELSEASNSESAQACGLQACYYLPQLDLASGMRMLQSSLPTSASQKRSRSAIIRGVLEQDSSFASVLDSAKGNVLKNSAWYGLAVAKLDCTANGVSESLGLDCPTVSSENVNRILALAEQAKDSSTEFHTLLNMAAAADFAVAAPMLTAMLTEDNPKSVNTAALGAIQVALLRGDRIPRDLVGQWVQLCDAAPVERQRDLRTNDEIIQ